MYRILKQIQYFYVMMDPPCSMHFLSNKSISSLARLAFSIDPATLFFDNSRYSNVHSTAMEFKALDIFFNDFDEFFYQFFAFVEHYIIPNSCFPLKTCLSHSSNTSNFVSYCSDRFSYYASTVPS